MSSPLFVICNQHGHYWGKSGTWVDGSEAKGVFQTQHQDEALNTLIELGAKDVDLRGKILSPDLSREGELSLTISDIPVPAREEAEAVQEIEQPVEEPSTEPEVEDLASTPSR